MRRGLTLLLLLLTLQTTIVAQVNYTEKDFAAVDNFVLTVRYENDIKKLANDLTVPFPEDINKARAIFKWICNNITFDYRFVNKSREIIKPDCEGQDDCPSILIRWEDAYLKKILSTKKAIADGYARLFKKLCDLCYVQAETITGYARAKPYQIGNNMGVNHSWNAVLIDTSWFYIDATWAAGFCLEDPETGTLLKFVKDYKNYYWLQPFQKFSRNHYPQNGKWVEKSNLTKQQFFNKPYYFSIDVLENLTEDYPATGVLKVRKADTLHFKFNYTEDIKLLQVNSNIFRNPDLWTTITIKRKKKIVRDTWAEKKQVYIPFNRTGNDYSFDYIVKESSLYYFELVFDYKPAIRYRIKVEP